MYNNCFAYEYKLEYWCHWEEKRYTREGIVFAESTKDAFEKISKYYLEPEDDFDIINIKAKENYELGDFVIETAIKDKN